MSVSREENRANVVGGGSAASHLRWIVAARAPYAWGRRCLVQHTSCASLQIASSFSGCRILGRDVLISEALAESLQTAGSGGNMLNIRCGAVIMTETRWDITGLYLACYDMIDIAI